MPLLSSIIQSKNPKVHHHDHFNGNYIAPTCNICNLKMQLKREYFPVLIHNLKNYDMHLLLLHGCSKMPHWHLSVVPTSSEKYISLTVTIDEENPLQQSNEKPHIKITFLDSCAFLPSSLAKLADTLHHDDLVYCHGLGHRKGVFPYSFFTSIDTIKPKLPFLLSANFIIQLSIVNLVTKTIGELSRLLVNWVVGTCMNIFYVI